MKDEKSIKERMREKHGVEVDNNRQIDITPLLVRALVEDEGWPEDELDKKMSELVGEDWRDLHASEWGDRLEEKGLMEFNEAFSRDTSDPFLFLIEAFEPTINESIYSAIVRLIGQGPNLTKGMVKADVAFTRKILKGMRDKLLTDDEDIGGNA